MRNESKIIRCILPSPFIYVNHIEEWLNAKALEGYELVKITRAYAMFKEGESKCSKHHIRFISDDDDEEMVINENDYEFVIPTKIPFRLSFWGDGNAKAYICISQTHQSEDNDDNAILKKATIQDVRGKIYPVINMLIAYGFWSLRLFSSSVGKWNTEAIVLMLSFGLPFFLFAILDSVLFLSRRKLIKYCKEKIPYPDAPRKATFKISLIMQYILGIWLIINVIMGIVFVANSNVNSVKDEDILTLRAIEGDFSVYLPEEYLDSYEDTTVFSAVVLPKFYYLYDYVDTTEFESSSIYYNIEYSRYNIKFLTDLSYNNVLSSYSAQYNRTEIRDYSVIFYTDESDGKSYILLKNQYEVIDIEYMGNRTALEVISNIEFNFCSE